MPYAVLRIYDIAPNLVDGLLAREADVRALLTGVHGFRAWGLVRTATGGLSLTMCDTAAGCTETVTLAADFLARNLADQHIAPPRVVEGEIIYADRPDGPPVESPYVAVRIIADPPPVAGLKELEPVVRENAKATPGWRSNYAFGPTNLGGGCTVIVAGNKEAAEAFAQRNRDELRAHHPEMVPTGSIELIEGTGVKIIAASDAVTA
jgi:hypothetical protein